jgi:hypothetical protein
VEGEESMKVFRMWVHAEKHMVVEVAKLVVEMISIVSVEVRENFVVIEESYT